MIELSEVSKAYGSTQAVNEVSFSINKGEVVGLLGPNGAGKTTTLNMLTGVLYPDSGRVLIRDQDITRNPRAIKSLLGYLPEDNPLYEDLLVVESIELSAQMKGLSSGRYQANLDKVVQSTGIKDIFYQPIEMLSKGLKQRVGLAQALISNPPVLILDEPTEGLDPNQRQEIRELISNLGKEHTVLLSSHVMQEVEAICQRVIILHKGKIVASDTVEAMIGASLSEDGGPRKQLLLECVVGGQAKTLIQKVKENLDTVSVSREAKAYRFTLDTELEEEFYRLIAKHTSPRSYIKHLSKVERNLEDVFRELTQES